MKTILVMIIAAVLIAGCRSSQPQITDNGEPGRIKVIVFLDENRNRSKDDGEVGVIDRVSISQEISCPPTNLDKIVQAETDPNGEAVFEGLKPGRYCVAYMGRNISTTKLTLLLDVSSEQQIQAYFGIVE